MPLLPSGSYSCFLPSAPAGGHNTTPICITLPSALPATIQQIFIPACSTHTHTHTHTHIHIQSTLYRKENAVITLKQRFSIPVIVHPHPSPRSAYFACLSLLTHLIQIISLLEVRSMHELCSDWHAPYTGLIAPYSLSRGNPLKFTSFRNIHLWIWTGLDRTGIENRCSKVR